MPASQLRDFLDSHGVKYVAINHSQAFTAQEVAASAHIPGKDMAKTVIVSIDGHTAMAVLPAADRVDLDLLKEATGANEVHIAAEPDFKDRFPECEVGAMPPFGNLYGMDAFVSRRLAEDENIAFNAGSHTELIQLSYQDFERLAHPKVVSLSSKD
jgi:Ala-tRNA(Pro) deacylase